MSVLISGEQVNAILSGLRQYQRQMRDIKAEFNELSVSANSADCKGCRDVEAYAGQIAPQDKTYKLAGIRDGIYVPEDITPTEIFGVLSAESGFHLPPESNEGCRAYLEKIAYVAVCTGRVICSGEQPDRLYISFINQTTTYQIGNVVMRGITLRREISTRTETYEPVAPGGELQVSSPELTEMRHTNYTPCSGDAIREHLGSLGIVTHFRNALYLMREQDRPVNSHA